MLRNSECIKALITKILIIIIRALNLPKFFPEPTTAAPLPIKHKRVCKSYENVI